MVPDLELLFLFRSVTYIVFTAIILKHSNSVSIVENVFHLVLEKHSQFKIKESFGTRRSASIVILVSKSVRIILHQRLNI